MKTIRYNVFETNSSSQHVVTVLNETEYEEFKDGKSYFCTYNGDFFTMNEWKKLLAEWSSDEADKKNKKSFQDCPDSDWAKEQLNDALLFRELTDNNLEKIWDYAITAFKNNDKGVMVENTFDENNVPDWTEAEARFLKRILENTYHSWNANSWGYGYENHDIFSYDTPSGDKIYILSYSGYGD